MYTHDGTGFCCSECACITPARAPRHSDTCPSRLGFIGLSPREKEVAILLSKGVAMKDLGIQLGISTNTVVMHKWNIYRKLGTHSVAELTRAVVQHEREEEMVPGV